MDGYIKSMRKHIGHDTLLVVGACVLPHRDGRLLLQKRRDNGCWAVHGGCVEIGERVEDAARRELLEETGLTAGVLTLLGVYSGEHMLYTYPSGDRVSIISVAYLCDDFSGELRPQPEEVAELRWFEPDELPEDLSPPDVEVIRQAAERIRARQ